MNIIDKPEAIRTAAAADLDRFRLRRFIETLPAEELETRSGTTDLADVAEVLEGNPRAVLFEAVGPERAQLARQRHRQPLAHRARLRRQAERVAAGDPAPHAQQA